jgi:uncharacterized protein YciI
MSQWFAVLRTRGATWDDATPMRSQLLWAEHAVYMNRINDQGRVKLAGPLETSNQVLLVLTGETAASVEALLEDDPWTESGQLQTTWIRPWNVLVGDLV